MITKTQHVVKMTTLDIKDNLGCKVFKQSSFKESLRNSIKFRDKLKVTAGSLPRNNSHRSATI